jgi:metal-responsive CopG/Arc/MetJ family transcriptional regulator
MSARRTNISIPETLYEVAQARIAAHYCDNFSDYIATLIREDVRRHHAGEPVPVIAEPAAQYPAQKTKRKRRAS